jgi:pimeloyl-ACP methyl ester carboxylesterase
LALRLARETAVRPVDADGMVTRWVAGPTGGRLRVRVGGSRNRAARAVVLLHGVVVSGRYLAPLGAELARDHAVAIPDLPGYGLSDPANPSPSLADLADAAIASAGVLDGDRVALIANSFGAQVALEAALRHPEKVGRIALIGPTTDPGARTLPRQYLRWQRCLPHEDLSVLPVIPRDLLDVGPREALHLLGVMLEDRPEEKAPRLRQPALVIRGERDRVAPAGWCRRLAETMPVGRFTEIPGAAHMPHWADPAGVAALLSGFLKEP